MMGAHTAAKNMAIAHPSIASAAGANEMLNAEPTKAVTATQNTEVKSDAITTPAILGARADRAAVWRCKRV